MKTQFYLILIFYYSTLGWIYPQTQAEYTFKAHTKSYGLSSAIFAPDGNAVLTSGEDGTAQLWSLKGEVVKTIAPNAGEVRCIAISKDGKSLALATADQSIQLWDMVQGTLKMKWKSKELVNSLAISPNEQYLLSIENSNQVELWDSKSGKLVQAMVGRGIQCMKGGFSPDGKAIVTGCNIGLKYWEIPSGKEISTFEDLKYEPDAPKPDKVNSAIFSKDAKQILTWYSGDFNRYNTYSKMQLWDLQGKRIQKFDGMWGMFEAVFSPDQKYILTGGYHHEDEEITQNNGSICLWEVSTGKLVGTVPAHKGGIRTLSFSPDGKFLLTASQKDREVKIWDAQKVLAVRTAQSSKTLAPNQIKTTNAVTKSETEDLGEIEISLTKTRYFALLISVQNYTDNAIKDLNEPEKDATKLFKTLATFYTFSEDDMLVLKDPQRADIINALDKLSSQVTENDNLLVFYAGHGYWDEKLEQGYWLPSDAQKEFRANWLANTELGTYIRGIKSKHTLLITDACFSGSIFEATRSAFDNAPSYIKNIYNRSSRKAMTSGMKEEVPDKSVFTQYLLKGLEENTKRFLTASELFNFVLEPVTSNTNNAPQFGVIRNAKHEGGDFIFVKK